MDTEAKRKSAFGVNQYWTCPVIVPDGTFDQADRQTLGYGYSGNLLSSFTAEEYAEATLNARFTATATLNARFTATATKDFVS